MSSVREIVGTLTVKLFTAYFHDHCSNIFYDGGSDAFSSSSRQNSLLSWSLEFHCHISKRLLRHCSSSLFLETAELSYSATAAVREFRRLKNSSSLRWYSFSSNEGNEGILQCSSDCDTEIFFFLLCIRFAYVTVMFCRTAPSTNDFSNYFF